ncbi:Helicase, C-terminal [Ostreococcus tauri]|uniref:Helicase, C-terminal n=1 Tax=Ostreococcus tauri TaxID=70448 RepID=A0A090M2N8_OSTTA|nr:Helicase, C-terminal [Ostreococcus tauri]CEF98466.1 Helicase, C-terminal [Ostreococcus tauri]|eukprot:XP_022839277.1 Helicase, C-terminal [Ostreococcus tauri]
MDGSDSDTSMTAPSGATAVAVDDGVGRRPRRAAARAVRSMREAESDSELDSDDASTTSAGRMDEDASMEDAAYRDVVERIVYCRQKSDADAELEYCVKWEGVSYRRCSWETAETLAREAPHKLKTFTRKHAIEAQDERYPKAYDIIDRVIAHREGEDDGSVEYLVKWCGLGYAASTWETSESVSELDEDKGKVERYWRFTNPEFFERTEMPRGKPMPPEFKNGMSLREYQVTSFEWMVSNYYRGRNVILGDEMGLGKTAQCISVMEYVRKNLMRRRQPMCVVAPLTTLGHWKREVEKWTDMNVIVFDGSAADREVCIEHEFFVQGSRKPKFDVMLVSFDNVRRNIELLERFSFAMCVVDEAHKMKDVNSQTTIAVTSLRYDWLLLLTGTPIQNNIKELYGMLHILDPRQFHSWEDFRDEFCDESGEVDATQVMRLRDLLKPRMLRRMKEDVEKIPAKEEVVVWVELTPQQRGYYRALYENQIHVLLEGSKVKSVPQLRNLSMELRKVCNHPFLCAGLEEDYTKKRLAACEENGIAPPSALQLLVEGSGKMSLLAKLLAKLKRDGHKVLIFSQFTMVLDLVQDFMSASGYECERLDGTTSAEDRQAGIDRFNTPGAGFAYLLSTRAGGMGITLTSADTAIIFDSDWNPQNDLQAMARCHRIGQTKEVKVYRFVTKDTYEQSLFETASRKYGLDEAILGGGDENGEEEGHRSKKTAKEQAQRINELLKYGVHGALKDASGEEANAFAAEDIDEILSRRAEHRDVGPRVGNSFSVATFGAEPGDGVDDETFWAEAFGDAAIQAAKEKAAEQVVDKRFAVEGPRKRKTVNYKESVALFQNQTPSLAPRTGTRTTYSERRAAAKRAREEDKKLRQEEREARRREREEELARQREDAKLNWFTWEVEVVVDALSAFGAPNGDVSRAVTCGTLDVDKPDEQKIAVAKTVMEMFDTIVRVRDEVSSSSAANAESKQEQNDDDKEDDGKEDDDKEDDREDTEETKQAVFAAMETILVPERAATALANRVLWTKLLRAMPRRAKLMKQRAALAKLIEAEEPIDLDSPTAPPPRQKTTLPKERAQFPVPVLGVKASLPAEWWTTEDDTDLLRGSLRYGYTPSNSKELERQFDLIRNDRQLRFASRTGVYDDGEYRETVAWPAATRLKTRLMRLLQALLRPPKRPSKAELLAAQRKAAAEAKLKRDMEVLRMWQEKRKATTPTSGNQPSPKRAPLGDSNSNKPQHQASLYAFFNK